MIDSVPDSSFNNKSNQKYNITISNLNHAILNHADELEKDFDLYACFEMLSKGVLPSKAFHYAKFMEW